MGNFILQVGEKMAGDKGFDILFQDASRKFIVWSSAWISPTLFPGGSFCFSDCLCICFSSSYIPFHKKFGE